jgi:hypothetical protein
VLVICKVGARAAGAVLLAILATALCLAGPTAASAAQPPIATGFAWGSNYGGALGDGSLNAPSTPVEMDLPAGIRVTAVASGGDWGLALTAPSP